MSFRIGGIVVGAGKSGGESVEPGQFDARAQVGAVGDVVDGAGKSVESGHMRAQFFRQQPRTDRKILALCGLAGRCLHRCFGG